MKAKVGVLLFVLSHLTQHSSPAQGSLTPPGPPAPTMKSLDQVEARTPISSLPFTISQPGSYYLTKNLSDIPGNTGGITVVIDHVTIDLNGFELIGANVSGTAAINRSGNADYLLVRNGSIHDWAGGGIRVSLSVGCTIENVRVSNCNGAGIEVGDRSIVAQCRAVGIGGGISVPAISVGSNSIVKECVATGCSGTGIQAAGGISGVNVSDCVASNNVNAGFVVQSFCTLTNCIASENSGTGFSIGGGCVVSRCTANSNGSSGFSLFNGSTIMDCAAGSNAVGISTNVGCTIMHCTAFGNSTYGFSVGGQCLVTGNTSTGSPTGFQISTGANRIDGNTTVVAGSGAGFVINGSNNLIVRNSALANSIGSNQYPISGSNNSIGVVIDLHSAGGTISNHEAWANFVY